MTNSSTQDFIKYEDYKTVKTFKLRETGNRPVREAWVKAKIKEIYNEEKRTWGMVSPVVVNLRTNHILDAQHRTAAWLRLMENHMLPEDSVLEVRYVNIPEEEEVEYIRKYNSGNNWTNNTFIESCASEGDENCIALIDFCKKHNNIGYRLGLALMCGKRVDDIVNGECDITKKMIERGDKVYNELTAFLSILGKGTSGMEGMAQAWPEYENDYTFKEWKSGFSSSVRKVNSIISNGKTAGKRTWEDAFESVAGTLSHKAKNANKANAEE